MSSLETLSWEDLIVALKEEFSEPSVDTDRVKELMLSYRSCEKDWKHFAKFDPFRWATLLCLLPCKSKCSARGMVAGQRECRTLAITFRRGLRLVWFVVVERSLIICAFDLGLITYEVCVCVLPVLPGTPPQVHA